MRYNYSERMVFGIPGGNPEEGETLHETLVRELKEELRITVCPGDLLFEVETSRPGEPGKHTLHCLFTGEILDGEPSLNQAETSAAAVEWVDIAELEALHLYPHLGKQIVQWHREQLPHQIYLGAILQPWV